MIQFLVGFACGVIGTGAYMILFTLLEPKQPMFYDIPDDINPKWR